MYIVSDEKRLAIEESLNSGDAWMVICLGRPEIVRCGLSRVHDGRGLLLMSRHIGSSFA